MDGELLVERGLRVLRDGGCDPVLAVLGPSADEVVARSGVPHVVCRDWERGLSASLRTGLAACGDADAVVIALVDQPLLSAGAVRAVVAGLDGEWSGAVAASYAGRRGHPVLLTRSVWGEVTAAAEGDAGAGPWMRQHPDRVREIACDGLGSDRDTDTRAELDDVRQAPKTG